MRYEPIAATPHHHQPVLEIFGNTTLKACFISCRICRGFLCFMPWMGSSLLLSEAEHGFKGRVSALQELFAKSFENAKLLPLSDQGFCTLCRAQLESVHYLSNCLKTVGKMTDQFSSEKNPMAETSAVQETMPHNCITTSSTTPHAVPQIYTRNSADVSMQRMG
jgi:hypothetical protein